MFCASEALSWEERAVQKLSYLKDQGIVDDVVSEVAIANREKGKPEPSLIALF